MTRRVVKILTGLSQQESGYCSDCGQATLLPVWCKSCRHDHGDPEFLSTQPLGPVLNRLCSCTGLKTCPLCDPGDDVFPATPSKLDLPEDLPEV